MLSAATGLVILPSMEHVEAGTKPVSKAVFVKEV